MQHQEDKINIALVDDHPMVIQGLSTILSRYPDIRLMGAYLNGKELLHHIAQQQPHILLLDIQLPDIPGDELVPQLLAAYPQLKILVLTNFESSVYISKMLWQGVHGYLLKTVSEDILIKAIHTVYNGGTFLEQGLKEEIDTHPLKSKKILAAKSSLTKREKEVLQLIVNGYTEQEISETLFLSLKTIKHYRTSILLKMDVKNTAMMVNKALKVGLAK